MQLILYLNNLYFDLAMRYVSWFRKRGLNLIFISLLAEIVFSIFLFYSVQFLNSHYMKLDQDLMFILLLIYCLACFAYTLFFLTAKVVYEAEIEKENKLLETAEMIRKTRSLKSDHRP